MGRRSSRNRHRPTGQAIVKAQATPPGSVNIPVAALIAAITSGNATQSLTADPLPRNPEWGTVPFGPGTPLVPKPINPVRVDSHRPEPRRYDFPVSANLPGVDQRLLPWKLLRDAADQIDLIRRCIEIRKGEAVGLEYDIAISKQAMKKARRENPGDSDHDLAERLQDELADDIDRIFSWWETPDPANGLSFEDWLMQLIEEHLVLDAIAIYPRLTLGGDLFGLEILDGSTIKPLLDDRGNTPMAPYPAYQQVLLGFPRGEFIADAVAGPDGVFTVLDAYRTDQLVYARRVVRTWTPYGYSPVEQSLVSADLWLKRQQWMRAEYTDGATPTGWITTDTSFQPETLAAYQAVFNDSLSGMTNERHRAKLLPKGFTPVETKDNAERYRPDFDEFLVKLVCGHLGVLPSRMGFTPKGGLGGKGHQEGEEDTQDRQTTAPTTRWIAKLLTRISRQYLAMPEELEFKFLGLDSEDEKGADEIADKQFRSGRMTLNEARDELGKARYDFPEADMPMVVGQTGVVFLEGELDKQAQSAQSSADLNVARAAQATAFGVAPAPTPAPGSAAQVPAGAPASAPAKAATPAAPAAKAKPSATSVQKADELAALRRYARKRNGAGDPTRTFICKALTDDDLQSLVQSGQLDLTTARYAKADDASREAPRRVADRPRGGDRPAHPRDSGGVAWADY